MYKYLLRQYQCMSFWRNFYPNFIKQLKWKCNYYYTIWIVASYGWQFQLQWQIVYFTSDCSMIYNRKAQLDYQRTRNTQVFRRKYYRNESTRMVCFLWFMVFQRFPKYVYIEDLGPYNWFSLKCLCEVRKVSGDIFVS